MKKYLARTSAIGLSAVFLLSVLAIFVPSAAAQQINPQVTISMQKDPNVERILPDTGVAVLGVNTKVAVQTASTCIVQVKVTFTTTKAPPYATVVLNPAQTSMTFGTQGGNVASPTGEEKTISPVPQAIVTVTRSAPAFEDGEYRIKAVAEGQQTQSGCNIGNGQAEGQLTVKNDYLPLTAVSPQSLFVKIGQNKKVIFPVDVQNLGNGPTRVKIDAQPAGKNRLDALNAGSELRLESKVKGASAKFRETRNIEAQTPHQNGYTNSIYSFTAKFTSSYDGTASGNLATDETSVTFSVQVQGVYVPGFEALGLLAALGVALATFGWSRRRA